MRIWFPILGAGVLLAGAGMIVTATRAQPAAAGGAASSSPATTAKATKTAAAATAWGFDLTAIDGKPMPMSHYRGKVVLLVNTASMCGFTPQYEGLQKLQETYGRKGFTVIGVPSGDFKSQEYDDNKQIKQFCESKFGINFPLAEKAHVTGDNAIPIYRWARNTLPIQNEPKWNFHKFLIGKDGRLIAGFPSKVEPQSPELVRAIEQAMGS